MGRYGTLVVAAALLAGCGEAAPGNPKTTWTAGSALVAIQVIPDEVTVAPGSFQIFEAKGYYANGTSRMIGATWTSSDHTVATPDSSGGTSALAAGTATISASALEDPSIAGTGTLHVVAGPSFGTATLVAHDTGTGFVKYDASGAVSTIAAYANAAAVTGFQIVGSNLYFIESTELHVIDIPSGTASVVGTIPFAIAPNGLVAASTGLLYTTDQDGTVLEMDPADLSTTRAISLGLPVNFGAIAIGPGDTIYVATTIVAPEAFWVYSVDLNGSFAPWIGAPSSPSLSRIFVTGGLAVADDGTVIVADARDGGVVYAGLDLDGDGYCNPAAPGGPEVIPFSPLHTQIQGLAIDASNVVYINDPGQGGIYAFDPFTLTETQFSAQAANVGTDLGGIQRPPAAP